MPIVTSIISRYLDGLPLGIIITASHNKHTDNGFKIAGLKGESIPSSWESYYEMVVNAKVLSEGLQELVKILDSDTKNFKNTNLQANINYAYDTRGSASHLEKILLQSLKLTNTKYTNYEIQTTPGLQLLTLMNQIPYTTYKFKRHEFSFVNKQEYFNFLTNWYTTFNMFYEQNFKKAHQDKYELELLIDCANGAAGYHKDNIQNIFQSQKDLKLTFVNTDYKDITNLNHNCGAEFVHKDRKVPSNYPTNTKFTKNLAFDGDVDRIVYFVPNSETDLKIVDGDLLATLYALLIKFIISKLSHAIQNKIKTDFKIGVVAAGYSNGAFMDFVTKNLGFDLILTKTGVKHLHHASKQFDLAIYFESNGHGTVAFDDNFPDKINKLNSFAMNSTDSQYLELLNIFIGMFNKTTGDSLSAMICTEAALKIMNMRLVDLYNTYQILDAVNRKVVVKDKNKFITNENELRLVEPIQVQNFIDETIVKYKYGRCFVRPSGTEDVVRIYAEADSLDNANRIAKEVENKILEIFNK